MNALFRFLASTAGRNTRIVAGVLLIATGLIFVGGPAGWIIALIGALPLLAGLRDVCIFAPLFRLPFVGATLRDVLK
jgi:hypothetical protein